MLSEETESKLINILKIIANGEMSIEINRKLLSDSSEFDPYQIFSNLTQKGKEFITPNDIVDYFNSKKIFISYTEAKLLILFYDQNYDGVLTFSEFLPLVQSKESSKNNVMNSPIKEMNIDIDYYLTKLFQKEIDLIREIIKNLYDIRIKKDFNCHSIYHTLKNVNKITEDSIGDYFDKKDISFLNDELIAIIKRLDINKDGIVDLCELHAFFGFPNCNFCCSCTECPSCGTCCCDECLPEIPCYLHKCIHHQCHSPLETKTICNSPLKPKIKPSENTFSSPLRDIRFNLNDSLTKNNYEYNNLEPNYIDCQEEKNNMYMSNDNLRNIPQNIKTNFIGSRIEIKNDYNPKKKLSSPRKYYINSQSDMGSTLYSTSPLENDYSQKILSNTNISSNNNNFSSLNLKESKIINKNENAEEQFKNYISLLMKIETDIEKGKIELSVCNDFTFENAFNIFDKDCKCYITFEDLREGLNYLGLEATNEEIKLLFNRLDICKCGNINYDNFVCSLIPYDQIYRNQIARNDITNSRRYNNFFNYETKLFFKNLMKLILSGEKNLNKARENFSNNINYFKNLFEIIDINGFGYFYEKELRNYLIEKGIFIDDKSCKLLFLNLDKNKDGKIDICEMEEEFKPII